MRYSLPLRGRHTTGQRSYIDYEEGSVPESSAGLSYIYVVEGEEPKRLKESHLRHLAVSLAGHNPRPDEKFTVE